MHKVLSQMAHLKTHTKKNLYSCQVCNKILSDHNSFRLHGRIHSGEKPYKCKFCNKAFAQIVNLNNHVRIHTGEKPYQCKFCNRAFIQVTQLNNHTRTHTGEKPFKCKFCCKEFTQVANLNSHVIICTQAESSNYDLHDKAFDELGYLNSHSVQTIKKPHICKFCDRVFPYACYLRKHIRSHAKEMTNMSIQTENDKEEALEAADLLSDSVPASKKKRNRRTSHNGNGLERKEPTGVASREREMIIQAKSGHLANDDEFNVKLDNLFTVTPFGCGICNEMFESVESFAEHCDHCDAALKDILGERFEMHLLGLFRSQELMKI